MPTHRFRHYPGLSPQQRRAIVDERLRLWLRELKQWQAAIPPADHGPWFPLADAMQALNKLAESLTGEPLWRPLGPHRTPASRGPK